MKTIWFTFFCIALSGTAGFASLKQENGGPRFEDYPAAVWRGEVALLNRRSHALARKFRTVIGEQLRTEGVNFAGHYTLASAGCGTGCSITAVIDARTGRAYFPNEFNGWTGIVGDYEVPEGEDWWTYRAGSRLLKATGRPRIGKLDDERYGPSGIYFYEWKNNHLRLVKFTPVGSYPNADPPGGPGH
jgi:hypothetical protein